MNLLFFPHGKVRGLSFDVETGEKVSFRGGQASRDCFDEAFSIFYVI